MTDDSDLTIVSVARDSVCGETSSPTEGEHGASTTRGSKIEKLRMALAKQRVRDLTLQLNKEAPDTQLPADAVRSSVPETSTPSPAKQPAPKHYWQPPRASNAKTMDKFVVPQPKAAVVRPQPEVPLNDREKAFSQNAVRRMVGAREGYGCGNSPFCTDRAHEHDKDRTVLGRLEDRVRRASESRARVHANQYLACVPAFPFDSDICGLEIKSDAERADNGMIGSGEFLHGINSGELPIALLGVMRLYHAELLNYTQTAMLERSEIERVSAERRDVVDSVTTNARDTALRQAAHKSIWRDVDDRIQAITAIAIGRRNMLKTTVNIQMRRLLTEHGVQDEARARAALISVMDDEAYAARSEQDTLGVIRAILCPSNESGDGGGGFFVPPERFAADSRTNKKRPRADRSQSAGADTRIVLDLTTDSLPPPPREQQQQQQTSSTPAKPPPPPPVILPELESESASTAAAAAAARTQSLTLRGVGPSQFMFGADVFACTSISVRAAELMAKAHLAANIRDVTVTTFLGRLADWSRVVEIGIQRWRERTDTTQDFENLADIVERSSLSEKLKRDFDILQFDGSLFAERAVPQTDAERLDALSCPDFESALLRCIATFKERPFSCAVNASHSTISLSRHDDGWFVFDSHGTTLADQSVLFSVDVLAGVVRTVKRLFHVEDRDPTKNPLASSAAATMDEVRTMTNLQYSMVCLSVKLDFDHRRRRE